jgi:hypothetical protein
MTTPQPFTHSATPESRGSVRYCPGVGRVERSGELAEQGRVVGQQARLTGKDGHDVTACELAQSGHQLMTDPVAQVGRVSVRRVLDRVQTEPGAQRVRLGPAQGENRVPRPGAHRRKTVGSGAPEQVDEDGLRLIVGRVTGRRPSRHSAEPGLARPRLEVRTGSEADAVHDDVDAELAGNLVHNTDILVGVLPQAMVDVMSNDFTAGYCSQHQEGEGVGTS